MVWNNERFLGFVTAAADKRSATRSVERSKFWLSRKNYKGGYAQVSCFIRRSPESVQKLEHVRYRASSRKDLTEGKVELGREI